MSYDIQDGSADLQIRAFLAGEWVPKLTDLHLSQRLPSCCLLTFVTVSLLRGPNLSQAGSQWHLFTCLPLDIRATPPTYIAEQIVFPVETQDGWGSYDHT